MGKDVRINMPGLVICTGDDSLGLDWRQVNTRDFYVWEFVRELNRPVNPGNRLQR